MKNKLIAIILTTAVIGGVGSTAYAAEISSNNTSNVVVSKSKSNCSYKKKHDRLSKKKHPFHHLVCNNRPTNCPGNGDIEEVVPPTTIEKGGHGWPPFFCWHAHLLTHAHAPVTL